MAAFANGPATQTTNVGTSATAVFNPNSTALQAAGIAGNALRDLILVNAGTVTVYIGQSTVTATTGTPLAPGGQLTLQGYSATAGNATNTIYGITASGTANVLADLASIPSVV